MSNRIGKLRESANVRLNIGCGDGRITGSINIDLHGQPDVKADARSLPYPNSFADWIECHHMLEHLELEDGKLVMDEWARVLKPGGYLLVTVPNLGDFLGYIQQAQNIPEMWMAINYYIYGQTGPGMKHLCCYSPAFLTYRLTERGFDCETLPWPYRPTPSFGILACLK